MNSEIQASSTEPVEGADRKDSSDDSPQKWLLMKAGALLVASLMLFLLFGINMLIPDGIPLIDEVILLLLAAFTGYSGKKRVSAYK